MPWGRAHSLPGSFLAWPSVSWVSLSLSLSGTGCQGMGLPDTPTTRVPQGGVWLGPASLPCHGPCGKCLPGLLKLTQTVTARYWWARPGLVWGVLGGGGSARKGGDLGEWRRPHTSHPVRARGGAKDASNQWLRGAARTHSFYKGCVSGQLERTEIERLEFNPHSGAQPYEERGGQLGRQHCHTTHLLGEGGL